MYELIDNFVLRLEDGAFIPRDEGNRHFQEFKEWEKKGNKAKVKEKPPKGVPKEVSAFQLKAALLNSGQLAAVETAMGSASGMVKLAWAAKARFRVDGDVVKEVDKILNLKKEGVDALLMQAGDIPE